MKIKKSSNRNSKPLILAAVAIIIGVVLYGGIAFAIGLPPFGANEDRTPQVSEQEKQRAEDIEEDPEQKLDNQSDTPTPPIIDPATQKQQVSVMMTSVGQALASDEVSASGFVTNSVEADGTCTYIFKSESSGVVVRKGTTTLPNPTSTTCKTVYFSGSELAAGIWNVSLEYTSSTSTGLADSMQLSVR